MRKLVNQKSSFWAGESFFDDEVDVITGLKRSSNDVVALAAYRNSIANFVRIVTQQNVPVKFNAAGDSYTDGKSVVISAKLSDKEFDHAVGLALHEGSHVVKSNFDVVKDLSITYQNKYGVYDRKECGIVKDLLNIVEDRRIDKWVMSTAPGYQGYYHALYAKYFNTSIINKGLASSEYRDETWESYFFRICNITNPIRDLDALKGLRAIWSELDLRTIDRLKSTKDALDVAFNIYDIVRSHLDVAEKENGNGNEQGQDGDGQGGDDGAGEGQEGDDQVSSGNTKDAGIGDGEGTVGDDDGEAADGSEAEVGNESGMNAGSGNETEAGSDHPELSDRQKKMLENAIKKQKEFQDGETRKKKVSKQDAKAIKAAQEADAKIVDLETKSNWGRVDKHRVMVLPRVTNEMLESNALDVGMIMSGKWGLESRAAENNLESIAKGFIMGQRLGKKLKARNEDKSLKYNRLRSGSIDKRRISNLGYGTGTVFQKVETMLYDDAAIHISIDASSSMRGRNWDQSVTMASAIAKAASMIEGLDVVISVRASDRIGNTSGERPIIMVTYDSTKDNIARFRTVMTQIRPHGVTPEGLCFEAIQNQLIAMKKGKEGYFLNLSDGMPGASNYDGQAARQHTRDQVNMMKKNGLHVLSYYVSESDYKCESTIAAFKFMYGADARFVNVESVADIANTMNAKFLVPKG
jgi:hypothetical protein